MAGRTHVVMYSGGIGSWAAARRLLQWHSPDKVVLLFADVIIEDWDLYRFLIETAGNIYGVEVADLAARCPGIPPLEQMDARKAYLAELRADTNACIPGLRWIADGRHPWEVFKKDRFLGNNSHAACSRELKQKMCRKWMDATYGPDRAMVHLGIDWTEIHRWKKSRQHWKPYRCGAPMCGNPLVDKEDMKASLASFGIALPRLYEMGYSHNNCSGACVKAGIAQWLHTMKLQPSVYRWSEAEEQGMRDFLQKPVSILRDRSKSAKCKTCRGAGRINDALCEDCEGTGKATRPLTLRELRENTPQQVDLFDWGGCGCFLGDPEEEAACALQTPAD